MIRISFIVYTSPLLYALIPNFLILMQCFLNWTFRLNVIIKVIIYALFRERYSHKLIYVTVLDLRLIDALYNLERQRATAEELHRLKRSYDDRFQQLYDDILTANTERDRALREFVVEKFIVYILEEKKSLLQFEISLKIWTEKKCGIFMNRFRNGTQFIH